jgi:hypothetical protein
MTDKTKSRSPLLIISTIIGLILSVALLYFMGNVVKNDFSEFRSCGVNNNGITIVDCGKQSLNIGDVMLLVLFFLSAILVVTLCTATWQMVRRSSK